MSISPFVPSSTIVKNDGDRCMPLTPGHLRVAITAARCINGRGHLGQLFRPDDATGFAFEPDT